MSSWHTAPGTADLFRRHPDADERQGGLERIRNSAFPDPEIVASRVLVWIVSAMVAFASSRAPGSSASRWPALLVIILAFVLVKQLGDELNNPFDNRANDTPMTALCRTIEIDLSQMPGEEDLPPLLEPVDGILMSSPRSRCLWPAPRGTLSQYEEAPMVSTTLHALALAVLSLAANRAAPVRLVYEVDCGAGGDLAAVLRRANNNPGATIAIRGTCIGNFVATADGLRLRGTSSAQSALMAPAAGAAQPVLDVRDANGVIVDSLGFSRGAAGVRFLRSHDGAVLGSEFHDNEVGVYLEASQRGSVSRTDFHDNEIGITASRHSWLSLTESTIRDNTRIGVVVWEHSTAAISGMEISGSGQIGIDVRFVSEVNLVNADLSENGDVHLYVDDRSRITVLPGVTVGDAGDTTREAVVIDDNSSFFGGLATYHGDVRVWGRSYAELASAVQGTVRTEQFSQTYVFNTQLPQPATCATGGDLVCSIGATATTTGCPSAPARCTAAAAMD